MTRRGSPSQRWKSSPQTLKEADDWKRRIKRQYLESAESGSSTFQRFHQELRPRLFHYAMTLTKNESAAEDLVQDTFLKLHLHREKYDKRQALLPWVFTITKRTFLDNRRKAARRREQLTDDGDVAQLCATASVDFDERSILQYLRQLSSKDRDALQMVFGDTRSHAEIAQTLGVTEVASRVRTCRAAKDLRKYILETNSD